MVVELRFTFSVCIAPTICVFFFEAIRRADLFFVIVTLVAYSYHKTLEQHCQVQSLVIIPGIITP